MIQVHMKYSTKDIETALHTGSPCTFPKKTGQGERGGKVREEHHEETSRSESTLTSESGNLAATAAIL